MRWSMVAVVAACLAACGGKPTKTQHSLNVTVDGPGRVTSSPGGIDCGPGGGSCSASFDEGASVTLTPAPESGARLDGWGGGCSGVSFCTVTMDSDESISALFKSGGAAVASIVVSPATAEIGPGQTQTFQAVAKDAGGAIVTQHEPFAWTSGNTSVATVTSGGVVTGGQPGTTTIRAAIGGVHGEAQVTVRGGVLQITRSGGGSGRVWSSPGGIDCGTDCTEVFQPGATVVLNAEPAQGSVFSGWTVSNGVCAGTGSCTVTVTGTVSVAAAFQASGPVLTVQILGNGGGTVTSSPAGIGCSSGTCTSSFSQGTTVTLTAQPNQNSVFSGWQPADACPGTGTCSFSLTADRTITATFTAGSGNRTLTVQKSGGGTGVVTSTPAGIDCGATCSAPFAPGSTVVLAAHPDSGCVLAGWSHCGGTDTCSVVLDSNQTVTAAFGLAPVTVSVSLLGDGGGTVTSWPTGISCPSGACSAPFDKGTSITLTAAPDNDSAFVEWGGACAGTTGTACSLTPTANAAVTARFLPLRTLSVTVAGSGSVSSQPAGFTCDSGTCTARYAHGETVVLTASPANNWAFTGWSGACTDATGSCSVSMTEARAVTATFVPLRSINVGIAEGQGTVTSTPAGISCPGTCSMKVRDGTQVVLEAAPAAGYLFQNWSQDCTGSAGCTLPGTADATVFASFDGPFDFVLEGPTGESFSMVAGETRTFPLTVRLQRGATAPVALTVADLPAGTNGVFGSATVTPTASTGLAITASLQAAPGQTQVTITGTSGSLSHTLTFTLHVRSPRALDGSYGLLLEDASYALVTESTRVVRLDRATRQVVKTVATGLYGARGMALEPGGTNVLVATQSGLQRVNRTTGAVAALGTGLPSASGVAIDATGTKALVTHCVGPCSSGGRLVAVTLATGAVQEIATGLADPRDVVPEAGGTTALVAEAAATRISRLDLTDGSAVALATFPSWSPAGLALEAGGATALASNPCGTLLRVHLGRGTATEIAQYPAAGYCISFTDFDVEAGGASVLALDAGNGRVVRIVLDARSEVVAPGRTSAQNLFFAKGVALEAGGTSALVTDCGTGACSATGRLVRVALASGNVTTVSPPTSALDNPGNLAFEPDGKVLVAETNSKRIARLSLPAGTIDGFAASAFPSELFDVAVFGSLGVTDAYCGDIWKFDRTNATKAKIATVPAPGYCISVNGVDFESTGETVLATEASYSNLWRANVSTGAISLLTPGLRQPRGVRVESASGALVATAAPGRLSRVDLATGRYDVLASTLGNPYYIALESATSALVTEGNRLLRVKLDAAPTLRSIVSGLLLPQALTLETGGATALFTDCGPRDYAPPPCRSNGRVMRLNLASGAQTEVTLPGARMNAPRGIAVDAGTDLASAADDTILVADCGAPGASGCSTGRLVTVANDGTVTVVPSATFDEPQGICVERPGKVLVVEGASGKLWRVDTTTGARVARGTGLNGPRTCQVEPGGASVLVSAGAAVVRIDLTTQTVTTVAAGLPAGAFAIEPGGQTIVVAGNRDGGGTGLGAALFRANLASGALDVLVPALFDFPYSLLLEGDGTSAVLLENNSDGIGAVFRLAVPPLPGT